jgi:hypothetical protein
VVVSQLAPLIQLEAGGVAPVLRYDIPEPTSYAGKNFIELEFDGDVFSAAALVMPSQATAQRLKDLPLDSIRAEVASYLRTGTSAREELPDLPVGVLRASLSSVMAEVATTPDVEPSPDTPPPTRAIDDLIDSLGLRLNLGYHLVKGTNFYGDSTVTPVPPVPPAPDPHLYLVETLRLTSFLGDYGAGRIVKTFSLLPGEVTKISVKTFRQTESTRKSASSVLDSLTKESASDLESSLLTEQSNQKSFEKTKEYYAEASGSASWGFGSASGKAGVKASTNATRQEAVKNISNATQKHSSSASAKREVEINTSYEVSQKVGEELSTERQVENINLSRTLNFVFRQMNQEFVTFLHLTDVRIGFFNGDGKSRREVPLSDLASLLEEVVKPSKQTAVRDIILEQLSAIRDHAGSSINVVDTVTIGQGDDYRQFDSGLVTNFLDRSGRQYDVPGVLLKVDYLVMRTEGVVVEALLGNGPALDSYAERLQELEVERRAGLVRKDEQIALQHDLINQIISTADGPRAEIAEKLLCPCGCRSAGHSAADQSDADPASGDAPPPEKT